MRLNSFKKITEVMGGTFPWKHDNKVASEEEKKKQNVEEKK